MHLTASEVGLTASAYLTGSVSGAIVFSYLTDRQGRKKWFMFTLLLYLAATVLTAFSWNLWSFMLFRFLTGAGIGGEYAAINSAIDELIPARTRGHTDLAINGSWWLGTAAGALLTIVLLNPLLIPEYLGWRLCFGFGAVLGVSILLVRRVIPESPRWLMTHGKVKEADEVVAGIEAQILHDGGHTSLPRVEGSITVHARPHATLATVARELFTTYPRRTTLGNRAHGDAIVHVQCDLVHLSLRAHEILCGAESQHRLLHSARLPSATSWAPCCSAAFSIPSAASR